MVRLAQKLDIYTVGSDVPITIDLSKVYGATFAMPGEHHRVLGNEPYPTLIVLFYTGECVVMKTYVSQENLIEYMKVLDKNPVVDDYFPKSHLPSFQLNGYWPIVHSETKDVLAEYAGESDVFLTEHCFINRNRIVSVRRHKFEWLTREQTILRFDNGHEICTDLHPDVFMRTKL